MKKILLALGLLVTITGVSAKPDVPLPQNRVVEIARDKTHRVLMVKRNQERLTKRWAFVIDSSHSTWSIAAKVITAFHTATGFPSDQLRYCAYVFNDPGWTFKHYRSWVDASPEEFEKTAKWIEDTKGVGSVAAPALFRALRQPVRELTVIIISDGGFSDGGGRGGEGLSTVEKIIEEGQKWRVKKGYGKAVICSIGLENTLCWPRYPKYNDNYCQQGMQALGTEGLGGYFYVQRLK